MTKMALWALAGTMTLGAGSIAVAGDGCGGGCCAKLATTQPAAAGARYVCPMGCASSDKPGKCPKCGMDMVKKEQPATRPAHQHQH